MSAERRALLLVVLGAVALRLVLLVARGDYIVYDEGYYLLLARSLRTGHGYLLNGLPHVALSPLQPLLVAAMSGVGVPDLWASRLLAAACGALLVIPVAALARTVAGPRAALAAAVLTAASPALMSFVPFFPGRSWNLYFGSEPLFLLLAFGVVACASRTAGDGWKWWVATGLLAALAYLTRAEGAVLAGALFLVLAVRLVARREGTHAWRRFGAAVAVGLVVAAPYLGYLRWALGRWTLSGRVQAAAAGTTQPPSAVQSARVGGQVLDAFVWQGDPEGFLRSLYGLDAAGTGMSSQYWGVSREAVAQPPASGPAAAQQLATTPLPESAHAVAAPTPAPRHRTILDVWWQGVTAVVPWWFALAALAGVAAGRDRPRALVWVLPLAACALLPSLLTYVEPRSLLPLAPLAAVYVAVGCVWAQERVAARWGPGAGWAPLALITLALVAPVARDLVEAWPQQTPLQQVATARRAVGAYLARHLPADSIVMSWHPAVAIWAARPWRVLPYDSFERIAAYARLERAAAVVFSRFEPSPIRRPPRPFTVVLPGAGSASGSQVQLEPVDETPLLFVGRLAGGPRSP